MIRPIVKYAVAILLLSFVACVPARKMEEEKSRRESCEKELSSLKSTAEACETERTELKSQMEEARKQIEGLAKDTSVLGNNYRTITMQYDKLNAINEKLQDRYTKLLQGNQEETKKLSSALQMSQEELIKKQDELKVLEEQLNEKKKNLEQLTTELKQREARVNELEETIRKKDEAVQALKKKVTDALLGFENKGLTITQKNGKVYVSMDESLLFASGSTKVEAKGEEALKKLAKVLEDNKDINILVEGHTDDVPMKGSGEIKDNWDLSVMRATSIVKIITGNSKVDPTRLTAAGRGEYFPIDPAKTVDARKKNRRTEIILTPKLDELFQLLETN